MDNIITEHNGIQIFFNEELHKYFNDDCDNFTSATRLLKKYFPFDTDGLSKKQAKKLGVTQESILAKWDLLKQEGCDLGNNIHNYLENYLSGKPLPSPISERAAISFKTCKQLCDKVLTDYDIIALEKIIFSQLLGVAGTIDLICRHKKTKVLKIVDWKTNKKIVTANYFKSFGLYPVDHIPNINFFKYSLQTTFYKYLLLLEEYYDEEIETFIFHIREDKTKVYRTEYYENEIKKMIKGLKTD